MDYIGSKEKLNDWLFSIMLNKTNPDGLIFLDACAGSGAVSKYAARYNFAKIISNDIMEFPSHIVRGAVSLSLSKLKVATELIKEMNGLVGVNGFFSKTYSEYSGRLYFSNENAAKIDACRSFIDKRAEGDAYLRSYLLYCLLEAFSAVSNTTGVQAAFLKNLKDRAQKPLKLYAEKSLHKYGLVKTYNENILSLLKSGKTKEDILYIDPPYNERQYGPNYHLYETLVKNDTPEIHGKTGLRDWQNESKSDFCSKRTCLSFTQEVVNNSSAKSIFISYNSDGLLDISDFKNVFGTKMEVFCLPQKRYKSDASATRDYNEAELQEYLFKIER